MRALFLLVASVFGAAPKDLRRWDHERTCLHSIYLGISFPSAYRQYRFVTTNNICFFSFSVLPRNYYLPSQKRPLCVSAHSFVCILSAIDHGPVAIFKSLNPIVNAHVDSEPIYLNRVCERLVFVHNKKQTNKQIKCLWNSDAFRCEPKVQSFISLEPRYAHSRGANVTREHQDFLPDYYCTVLTRPEVHAPSGQRPPYLDWIAFK